MQIGSSLDLIVVRCLQVTVLRLPPQLLLPVATALQQPLQQLLLAEGLLAPQVGVPGCCCLVLIWLSLVGC